MKKTYNNSSLTISCSLSLLLIGLFIHIDQGKSDKELNKKSNTFFEEDKTNIELCNSNNIWTYGLEIKSDYLNEFFSKDLSIIDSDFSENKISEIGYCVSDKNLIIEANLKDTLRTINGNHISLINEKLFHIQNVFKKKNIRPNSIEVIISIPEKISI